MLPNVKNSRKTRYPSGSPARACEDAQILLEWQKQLTAYVAWVNSQLKKKPGAHLVEDLRNDVRDGVALIDLIHVIANEEIDGVHHAPSTYAQMKENVDKVLLFMSSHKIKMHHITTRDIVEGNLKAIMRLVLALAAHYKPNSVRHSSQANKQNIAGIAQGAAATLTEARRNATRAGHRYRRRRQREDSTDTQCSDSDHSQNHGVVQRKSTSSGHLQQSSHPHGGQPHHHHHHHRLAEQRALVEGEPGLKMDGRAELEGASASSSPVSSRNASPRASLYLSEPSSSLEGLLAVASNQKGNAMVTSCESDVMVDSGYTEIMDSVKDTHQMLFHLHDLLLNGEKSSHAPPECAQSSSLLETITILKARVLHNEEIAEALRVENNKIKNECRELYGTKAALQQRLAEQESQLSSVKSEVMRLELDKETMALELEALKKQLIEREQVLSDVKKSFVKQAEDKERLLSDLRKELFKRDHSAATQNLQNNHQDRHCGDYKLADRSDLAELELIRDNIKQAKSQMSFEDPRSSVMDSLEDSLARLLDKVHINGSVAATPSGVLLDTGRANTPLSKPITSPRTRKTVGREPFRVSQRTPQPRPVVAGSPAHSSPARRGGVVQQGLARNYLGRPPAGVNVPIKGSPGRLGKSQIPVPNDLTVSGGRSKSMSPNPAEPQSTNVVYYLANSDKPFTCLIRKKLGDIRLRDLKSVIPDSNVYHYFFKALDPEYGSVKEELSNDDDLLPGWEGKIVAWLEEETGTAC